MILDEIIIIGKDNQKQLGKIFNVEGHLPCV